ncbi:TOMM precursor leader peptide-binding protein [Amycolatopsis rhizosphaerae]|uniref:TOMM precursor leader peptide-binding protein n=1 Tax=Amycolatopsis rhizosphaerae TaxID=2053003 RepID=UPI001FE5ED6F|nr:TOMM precursor leader peptide-binding protein [Amycolatopsis rhizosphaerae]
MSDQTTTIRHDHRLPRRPRLKAGLGVFDRRPGEVQIGLDPRHAMVASDLSPDLVRALRLVDGRHRLDELLDLTGSEHREQLREILLTLTRLGLVEEAWAPAGHGRVAGEVDLWSLRARQPVHDAFTRRAHSAVVLYGTGRLTMAIATLLAASGVGHVQVEAEGLVAVQDVGTGYLESDIGRQRRLAAASAITRVNRAVKNRRLSRDRQPELAVLADAIVPAPELVRLLMHEGVPHLPVRVREGLGIVGPLVYPGRSTCLGCADLHRKARDFRWPVVAGQLAGRSQPADLGTVQATAGVAVGQILRALSPGDGPPPTWNTTIEIDTFDGTIEHRAWPPYPDCDCGAQTRHQ